MAVSLLNALIMKPTENDFNCSRLLDLLCDVMIQLMEGLQGGPCLLGGLIISLLSLGERIIIFQYSIEFNQPTNK